jgi:hypothetical protein
VSLIKKKQDVGDFAISFFLFVFNGYTSITEREVNTNKTMKPA